MEKTVITKAVSGDIDSISVLDTLFVLKLSGKPEGSFILDNKQHSEYRKIPRI